MVLLIERGVIMKNKMIRRSYQNLWLWALFMAVVLPLAAFSNASAYFDKKKMHMEAYTQEELREVIETYQADVNTLNGQIKDIKKDTDWLVMKINRIADSGRKVPRQLHQSVQEKEKRFEKIAKERDRIQALMSEYQRFYDQKYAKPEPKPVKTAEIKPAPTAMRPVAVAAVQPVRTPPVLTKSKRDKIETAIKMAGLADWVDVTPSDDGCAKLENTLPILFSSGSATLANEYRSFLKKLAGFLKTYDVKVYVSGYADPDPINTAKYPSNFELGASRAANVVHEMVKSGLKPSVFNIGTTGQYRFAAKQSSNQKSFQRRANLTVVFSG